MRKIFDEKPNFPHSRRFNPSASAIIRKSALNLFDAPVLGIAVAYTFSFLLYSVILMFSKPTHDTRFFWAAGIGQALSWVLSIYTFSVESFRNHASAFHRTTICDVASFSVPARDRPFIS
jgi:hypothetical protein